MFLLTLVHSFLFLLEKRMNKSVRRNFSLLFPPFCFFLFLSLLPSFPFTFLFLFFFFFFPLTQIVILIYILVNHQTFLSHLHSTNTRTNRIIRRSIGSTFSQSSNISLSHTINNFKIYLSQLAKIVFKSTMVGEIFEIYLSKMSQPWLEKILILT